MTHECRRAQVKDEHAVKQSSGPKPISQSDGQVIHILRERIEKDILDKTKKALMKFNDNRERASSAQRWPSDWKDLVHDEDGGYDMFGRRTPQDGRLTLKQELSKLALSDGQHWAQDDVTGGELDPELVKQAREVEMTFFRKMEDYTRVPRAMQKMKGGKTIGVRWVDVNKGDSEKPDMRIRLVGQEQIAQERTMSCMRRLRPSKL